MFRTFYVGALATLMTAQLHAATRYPSLKNVTTSVQTTINLLSDCVNVGSRFKRCTIASEIKVEKDTLKSIDPLYRVSTKTGFLLEGSFENTGGNFDLVIDGVSYAIRDGVSSQYFPLPSSRSAEVTVKVSSRTSGSQTLTRNMLASITSLKLVLDNSGYVSDVLNDLDDLKKDAEDFKQDYELEKNLNALFKTTLPEIRAAKVNLTGRPADDFGDCQKTQSGIPDLLDIESCQYYRIFNAFLKGQPTGISDKSVSDAFDVLNGAVTAYSAAIAVLQENQVVFDDLYISAQAELLQYLKDAAQTPAVTPAG